MIVSGFGMPTATVGLAVRNRPLGNESRQAGAGNVIVGLWLGSYTIGGAESSTSATVQGNMIGVDATGSFAFPRGGRFDGITFA